MMPMSMNVEVPIGKNNDGGQSVTALNKLYQDDGNSFYAAKCVSIFKNNSEEKGLALIIQIWQGSILEYMKYLIAFRNFTE